MAFMEWNQKYVLNVKEVDEQHQRLFEIVSNLYDCVVGGVEQNALGVILDELIDYTVNHFETEEKMHKEHNYIFYEEHKKEHDDLTRQVLNLQGEFREKNVTISFEVLDFLSDWLKNHTTDSDMKFAQYVNI